MRTTEPAGTSAALNHGKEEARQFVSVAVHDMRAALRAIRTNSELLAAKNADPASEGAVRHMQHGVERLEALIHDIAEFCYEEVREFDMVATDLSDALLEAKGQLAAELRNSGAVIIYDPLPTVPCDFLAIATVFRCLIGNACKFRRECAPQIHVGAVSRGSDCVLSIQDNGVGFDPAYQDLIFKPFERLSGQRYPGSGLGLSVARRILERHGGRIWAESKPGEGSTFWFSLPASD